MDERTFQGLALLVGIILGSIVAYHFVGWIGVAGVVSAYCIWRAV